MELWYTENHTENVRFSIKVDRHLTSITSEFQRIDVFESYEFGRLLVLDGYLMLTEKDEYIYHEMITHIPMAVNPGIRNILLIGAGDGGALRELCRYDCIEKIHLAEIDKAVVDTCKEYFPKLAVGFNDPRVTVYYEDGLKFIRDKVGVYDLIIVDSTDPFGVGEGLFTKEFYGNCNKSLAQDGILINQHESVFYDEYADSMEKVHEKISSLFKIAAVYQAHIPTYPSGHWLFGFASETFDPVKDLKAQQWNNLGIKTRYYNTELHKGCFALPNNYSNLR
ncbi:MAG: polyamine aminopropyltransferase [Oscillospiraceae bacterium]|jgi:spermidine synthase|nr:polyamine aminopropyltransferase [Oscillospiraceae bacterium]